MRSLSSPQTLFQAFDQKPIQKTHWVCDDGARSTKIQTRYHSVCDVIMLMNLNLLSLTAGKFDIYTHYALHRFWVQINSYLN